MQKTNIPWCDMTWNPVVGCTACSPGCANCYARELHTRRHKAFLAGKKLPQQYALPFSKIQLLEDRLTEPLHVRTPQRIFVCSMSDLFHEDVPFEFVDRIYAMMALCPQHTFIIVTKRSDRMKEYYDSSPHDEYATYSGRISRWFLDMRPNVDPPWCDVHWPLPNVHLYATCCNQPELDHNAVILLQTPAAVRGVNIEPMLGAMDLSPVLARNNEVGQNHQFSDRIGVRGRIHSVILGGESVPGARPMDINWARGVRDQCVAAKVPFFFKQIGGVNRKKAGRLLDGREWNELPGKESK